MPKKAAELSVLAVKNWNTVGMKAVGGVDGLYLKVEKSGGRSWILRATIGGDRRDMGLGGYPDVSLAMAREEAKEAHKKIRNGVDPIEERLAAVATLKLEQANALTFSEAAARYIRIHASAWKNAKHTQQWTNSLTTHAYPLLGAKLVRDITTADVLAVLEPLWTAKTETASRVRGRMESVLSWASTLNYCKGPNPARWKGHLQNLLPSAEKIKDEKHFPALPYVRAGAFMSELRTRQGMGALALEFGILTAARSGEIRGAVWGEIDLEAEMWLIPKERMKAKEDHRVPLPEAAMVLLEGLLPPGANGKGVKPSADSLIFLAPRGGKLSDETLNAVIERMNEDAAKHEMPLWLDPKDGRRIVQHGFRSTFRDWVSDCTSYPSEMAEFALAHTVDTKVAAAYRRMDQVAKRRQMMDDWAAFCDQVEPAAGNVVRLRKSRVQAA